jgi:Transposase DDE domain group 1
VFCDFRYRTHTRDSWSSERRVIGKAEHTLQGANPGFVAISPRRVDTRTLYEDLYCARGEAERRIGEQFELFVAAWTRMSLI